MSEQENYHISRKCAAVAADKVDSGDIVETIADLIAGSDAISYGRAAELMEHLQFLFECRYNLYQPGEILSACKLRALVVHVKVAQTLLNAPTTGQDNCSRAGVELRRAMRLAPVVLGEKASLQLP